MKRPGLGQRVFVFVCVCKGLNCSKMLASQIYLVLVGVHGRIAHSPPETSYWTRLWREREERRWKEIGL